MLWVYGHYKDFTSYSAEVDFRRQNLTSKVDPCAVRVNGTLQRLRELSKNRILSESTALFLVSLLLLNCLKQIYITMYKLFWPNMFQLPP